MLQSIPLLAPLQRVKLGMKGTSTDPHILDWQPFKEWCLNRIIPDSNESFEFNSSSLRRLKGIDVELWQVYDQVGCMKYEMREVQWKRVSAFCPNFVLPEEEGLLLAGVDGAKKRGLKVVEYVCQDEACREYRGNSSIGIETQHRYVIRIARRSIWYTHV